MSSEQEQKQSVSNPKYKEFKSLLDEDFKERKLKETPKDWKVDKFKKFITLKRGHDLPLQNRSFETLIALT